MPKEKILIIEDDPDIVEMISYNLEKEGYRPTAVLRGDKAFFAAKKENPDLIILDLMLPEVGGLEICRALKENKETSHIPIIILTAKSGEEDKVIGLELGADDYMAKPFSPRELTARIRAVLRRFQKNLSQENIKIGVLALDSSRHKATVKGKKVLLTPVEFKLLEYMAKRPGMVLSREKILNNVFGYDHAVYDRTIDTHIKSLRKKLQSARDYIETVRGVGYRFKDLSDDEE